MAASDRHKINIGIKMSTTFLLLMNTSAPNSSICSMLFICFIVRFALFVVSITVLFQKENKQTP